MKRLSNFFKEESGTTSIEFVFVFPIIFLIFTASFESSMFMARYVMLERSVDLVVRKIRLGQFDDVSHEDLKKEICRGGLMVNSVSECMNSMKIWMQPINTADFAMPATTTVSCVDSIYDTNTSVPPGSEFAYGGNNEIMLLRICLKEDPMFPTTAVSVRMPTFSDGTYALMVTSAFVNEPSRDEEDPAG
jgi:hypothetical protein